MLNPGSSDSIQSLPSAIHFEEIIFTRSLAVIDELANFDVIFGQDWFHDFNPNVDFDNHVVHIEERFIHGREDSVTECHAHLLKYMLHLI